MKCAKASCFSESEGGMTLNVPAKGIPIKEHDPIQLIFGVELCRSCLETANPSDFLTAQIKKIVCFQAKGLAEPDFARAFFSLCAFDSKEWIALKAPKKPR